MMMKLLKFFVKSLVVLTIILGLVWAAGAFLLQTERGQEWLVSRIVQYIENETETNVTINKVQVIFPLKLRIFDLAIKKDQAPLLSVDYADLNCLSPQLFKGKIVCSEIHIKDLYLANHPFLKGSKQTLESQNTSFPYYVKIIKLNIEGISLEPGLLGSYVDNPHIVALLEKNIFDLTGSILNDPHKNLFHSHLKLAAIDPTQVHPPLLLHLDLQNDNLSMHFHTSKFPLKNYAEQLDGCCTDISLKAHGNYASWQGILSNTKPTHPILGSYHILLKSSGGPLKAYTGQQSTLEGEFQLESKQKIDFNLYKLVSPFLLLQGHLTWDFDSHIEDTHFSGQVLHLSQLAKGHPIEGDLNFEGTLSGSIHAPSVDLKIMAPKLIAKEHVLDHLLTSLQFSIREKTAEGTLKTSFMHKDFPYQLESAFACQPDHVRLNRFLLEGLGAPLHGQGELRLGDKTTGHLTFQTDEVSTLAALFYSEPMNGQVGGELDFHLNKPQTGPLSIKECQAHLKAHHFECSGIKINSLDADAFMKDGFKGDLKFALHDIVSTDFHLDELNGETSFDLSQHENNFKLSGKGTYQEDVTFRLAGHWSKKEKILVHMDSIHGFLGPYPFDTLAPFDAIYASKDDLQMNSVHFRLGEGEFKTGLKLQNKHIEASCQGIQVPSELLHFVYPEAPLTGRASFEISLKGPLDQPNGSMKLWLHHIQITENIFAAYPSINGAMDIEIQHPDLSFEGVLYGIGKTPISAKGKLPLKLSLSPWMASIDKKAPFQVNLEAEGELDPYLHLFYNDSTNLAGDAKIALGLQGSLSAPQIQGAIDITNGSYESFKTGAIYKNIQARVEGDGTHLVLKHFSAQDIKHGSISATGSLVLDPVNHFPFEFQIQPTQIYILDSDYATMAASGMLQLKGNKKEGSLQGKLNIDQATIRMEEALPAQVKSVDFKYINAPEDQKATLTTSSEHEWPLDLDIHIDMPGTVKIQGNNLSSEWKGDLVVTGTPSHPILNGELRINQGDYNFNGKKFILTQGNLHFAGSLEKKTTLYVVASKEVDKIKAEIIVKGPISKLAVSFRSNPPLSQREVLSYILFGRGIADITSDQGNLLTQSFVDLKATDQTQTADFLTRIRNNMGIDRLDFSSTDRENKDLSLQVGKYISDNILISINKSINAAANRVSIEAKLRKNVQAQAEVGDDAQGKVLLKWKKDY